MEYQNCPLEAALMKIENSSRPSEDIRKGVSVLQRMVSNLISHPSEEKFRVFKRDNELLAKQLFILDGIPGFLKLIGFEEKSGVYRHSCGDEKMGFLPSVLKALNSRMKALDQSIQTSSPSSHSGSSTSNLEDGFGSSGKKSSEFTIQLSNKLDDGKAEYSFNSQGHYHQQGQKLADKKKGKDLFDKHDLKSKKGNEFAPLLKMG